MAYADNENRKMGIAMEPQAVKALIEHAGLYDSKLQVTYAASEIDKFGIDVVITNTRSNKSYNVDVKVPSVNMRGSGNLSVKNNPKYYGTVESPIFYIDGADLVTFSFEELRTKPIVGIQSGEPTSDQFREPDKTDKTFFLVKKDVRLLEFLKLCK